MRSSECCREIVSQGEPRIGSSCSMSDASTVRPRNAVRMTENFIHVLQFLILFPSVPYVLGRVRRVEIAIAWPYQHWFRCKRIKQIPSIESGRAGIDEVLFGVIRRAGRKKWLCGP